MVGNKTTIQSGIFKGRYVANVHTDILPDLFNLMFLYQQLFVPIVFYFTIVSHMTNVRTDCLETKHLLLHKWLAINGICQKRGVQTFVSPLKCDTLLCQVGNHVISGEK